MCGMSDVWCTMPEMSRLDVKYFQSVVVRYGMYRHVAIASLPPHFTLHLSTSNTISDIIPSHTTFHVTPSSVLTISHISYRHRASHYSNLQYHIDLKSHHIVWHCTPFSHSWRATFHVLYATFQITRYIGHIYASHHHIVAPHFTQDVAPHFTCSTACIIPPQSVWPWSHP